MFCVWDRQRRLPEETAHTMRFSGYLQNSVQWLSVEAQLYGLGHGGSKLFIGISGPLSLFCPRSSSQAKGTAIFASAPHFKRWLMCKNYRQVKFTYWLSSGFFSTCNPSILDLVDGCQRQKVSFIFRLWAFSCFDWFAYSTLVRLALTTTWVWSDYFAEFLLWHLGT